jgi:hypothetical protein
MEAKDFTSIWAAVAATFSALTAMLLMLIQRRNLLESVTPVLVLTGWEREHRGEGEKACEVLTMKAIRNVGRGVALNIMINSPNATGSLSNYVFSATCIPVLAPNETYEMNREMIIYSKTVQSFSEQYPLTAFDVRLSCKDSAEREHVTTYRLIIAHPAHQELIRNPVGPGVEIQSRWTTIQAPRSRSLPARIGRWFTGKKR